MKKLVLISVLAICFAGIVLGSVRYKFNDTEIMQMIERSKDFNPGVSNPDRIYPGQVLTFLFEDGSEESIVVEEGDSQWKIVGQKLGDLSMRHGAVVDYPNEDHANKLQFDVPDPITDSINPFWWLALMLLAVILFAAIFKFFEYGKKSSNENPVTAGPPQIEGGVKDDQIRSVVQSRYPNCTILSIEKGRLYGKGVPYYNFSPLSMKALMNNVFGKNFNGEVGYQVEVLNPSGQKMLVQTLAGCGNEIRMNGKFLTGVTFVKDGEQPTILNHPAKETVEEVDQKIASKVSEELKTEKTKTDEVLVDTELLKVASEHSILTGEFLKSANAFKVTLEVTLQNGANVKTILETVKSQPKPEKTEEKK